MQEQVDEEYDYYDEENDDKKANGIEEADQAGQIKKTSETPLKQAPMPGQANIILQSKNIVDEEDE